LPKEVQACYAAWERSAASTLLVLIFALAASSFVGVPNVLFVAGNLSAGVFVFLAWRCALRQRTMVTLIFAVLGIAFALLAFSSEAIRPFALVLLQGPGLLAAALFACILATRKGGEDAAFQETLSK
jgi:hypothetical protein